MPSKGQGINAQANNKRVLQFNPGEEYKIKIEKPEEFSTSIFHDQYERAFKHVKTIISTQPEESQDKDDTIKDTYNNVIAFVGGRGSGKSSAMISFRDAVKLLKKSPGDDFWKNIRDESLGKSHFETIEIIDPSMFEEGDSILEIIVAQLFRRFDQKINDKDCRADYNKKREVLECFQGLYDNLKTIQKKAIERLDGEVIETLAKLASGSNLKSSIIKLVKKYLEFMSDGQDQRCLLLIAIDDFDLNTGHVYSMAEQIRKYLVIPGVIILMAVKIDQLSKIIESAWQVEFDKMIEKNRMESDEPQIMTARYLEKLIPENRRLYLPQLRSNEHKDITIQIPKEEEDNKAQHAHDDVPVEDAILGLIYSKTGLIFLKQEYNIHFLIPDNLRDLHGFYVLLTNLDDVDIPGMLNETDPEKKKVKIEKIRSNLKRFEDYFFYTWIKNKLAFWDQETIEMFMNVDIRQKNKYIIQEVRKKIKMEYPRISLESSIGNIENEEATKFWGKYRDYANIIQRNNNSLNISLGDVLYCLKILVTVYDYENDQLFAFALKTAYSIMLFKLIIIEDKYQDVQILLGGSIYNFNDTKLIRASEEDKKRRDHFQIDYSIVGNLYKDQVNMEALEWLHYFLLFVGDKSNGYRDEDERQYYAKETNLGQGNIMVTYATFDVLAFVFFLFNPLNLIEKSFPKDFEKLNLKEGTVFPLYPRIIEWRELYRAALPVFSIEFLEQILSSFPKDLKGKAGGYHNYFSHFLINLEGSIADIKDNTNHLKGKVQWILDAFKECPLIIYTKIDSKSEDDRCKFIDLLNNIFKSKGFEVDEVDFGEFPKLISSISIHKKMRRSPRTTDSSRVEKSDLSPFPITEKPSKKVRKLSSEKME